MPRAFDKVCARCRRAGTKLFLKAEKCTGPQCPFVRRSYAPGVHGQSRKRGRPGSGSDFGKQLMEKQSLKAICGIRERQLRKYYDEALKKKGVTADLLLSRLEARLDNAVYRLGYGETRAHARQLVGHGLFAVDGRKVDIPSFEVKKGQVISVNESKRNRKFHHDAKIAAMAKKEGAAPVSQMSLKEKLAQKPVPAWLERSGEYSAKVTGNPGLEFHERPVDMQAIIEFYSR